MIWIFGAYGRTHERTKGVLRGPRGPKNFQRLCFKELSSEVLHDGLLMSAGNLISAISAVFRIIFADRSTQWILAADGLIFTRLVMSEVGEVFSRLVALESTCLRRTLDISGEHL